MRARSPVRSQPRATRRGVEVAGHHLRAADPELAVDELDLGAGHRAADGARRRGAAAVGAADRHRRLGHAVALRDGGVRESRSDGLLQRRGEWRAAGHDQLECRVLVRRAGERRHERRRHGEDGHAVAVDRGLVPARQRDDGGARGERRGERDDEPHHVAERRHGEDDVAVGETERELDLAHRRDHVAVGEHDALGQAGRPAREREERERVRVGRRRSVTRRQRRAAPGRSRGRRAARVRRAKGRSRARGRPTRRAARRPRGRWRPGGCPVTAPPAAIAPNATPAHGGMFGAHSASTSPGAKPRAASAAVMWRVRAASGTVAPVSPSTSVPRMSEGTVFDTCKSVRFDFDTCQVPSSQPKPVPASSTLRGSACSNRGREARR